MDGLEVDWELGYAGFSQGGVSGPLITQATLQRPPTSSESPPLTFFAFLSLLPYRTSPLSFDPRPSRVKLPAMLLKLVLLQALAVSFAVAAATPVRVEGEANKRLRRTVADFETGNAPVVARRSLLQLTAVVNLLGGGAPAGSTGAPVPLPAAKAPAPAPIPAPAAPQPQAKPAPPSDNSGGGDDLLAGILGKNSLVSNVVGLLTSVAPAVSLLPGKSKALDM